MSGSSKTYGLIVPKKGSLQPRHSVFGDDSSDDGSGGASHPIARKAKPVPELDGELLQYDEYHDELQRERAEQQKSRRENIQARYIPLLMQQAERRKKEAERRAERLVQKEREAEGDRFQDKETFVTSSYRKKVEEFAKMDAEDKRQEKIEELADVTKQKDLGAFYSSLYKQTVDADDSKVKVELEGDESRNDNVKDEKMSVKKSRHYRKRKSSSSSEDHSDDVHGNGKEVVRGAGHRGRNGSEGRHAQSSSRRRKDEHDRSLSSSSKRKKLHEVGKSRAEEGKSRVEEGRASLQDVNHNGDGDTGDTNKCVESGSEEGEIREEGEEKNMNSGEDTSKIEEQATENVDNAALQQVEKVNIWEKRTVGEVFEVAVQRYWKRKAARDAARAAARAPAK